MDAPQSSKDSLRDDDTAPMSADPIPRLHALWRALAAGQTLPALSDFTPDLLRPFKSAVALIDVQDSAAQPRVRYIGPALGAVLASGAEWALSDPCNKVIANHAPLMTETALFAPPDSGDRLWPDNRSWQNLLLPLRGPGQAVEFILALITWTDGSKTQKPEIQDPPDLPALLKALRAEALVAGRSRLALYELLVRIHAFAAAARSESASMAALYSAAQIKAQARAPYTPILKLIFGPDHDKTRLTEYATTLAHADRQRWTNSEFEAALQTIPGGLKAMIERERAARRPRRTAAAAPPSPTVRATIADWRAKPQDGASGDGHYLLLLARSVPGTADQPPRLDILGLAEDQPDRVRPYVRKLAPGD